MAKLQLASLQRAHKAATAELKKAQAALGKKNGACQKRFDLQQCMLVIRLCCWLVSVLPCCLEIALTPLRGPLPPLAYEPDTGASNPLCALSCRRVRAHGAPAGGGGRGKREGGRGAGSRRAADGADARSEQAQRAPRRHQEAPRRSHRPARRPAVRPRSPDQPTMTELVSSSLERLSCPCASIVGSALARHNLLRHALAIRRESEVTLLLC